jgi:hypothetical protein
MKDENGNIVFDVDEQAKVDEIVKDRLARAKAEKPADYDDLKEIEKDLEAFGYSGTPAEKKAAIKAYRAEIERQQAQQSKPEKEEEKDEDLEAIKADYKAKKDAEKAQADKEAAWNKQVEEFNTEYPDIDVKGLESNEEFIDFVSGSGWTLKQAYSKFIKFYGEIEAKTTQKVASKIDRATGTGKGGEGGAGNYGLSQTQKDELESWNRNYPQYKMTPKEYKERLG